MKTRILGCVLGAVGLLATSGCGFSPYQLPLPGGADLGAEPYSVKIAFRDVLDLVPQSAVRVDDIAVGKVTDIELDGWNAIVTVKINRGAKLPDNTVATIRQTSLLGEKFVSLAPPATGEVGSLGNGDKIPLDRSGRNPEIEEVLGAASLLFNGGGLEKTNTIVKELNNALGDNEPEVKELIASTTTFISQLDDNKAALITSLEKVNRLAKATDKQKDAITGALDDLPDALRVVNDQRDDLVGLLQSLDRLSDVATGVIRTSKADTVADLKALVPTIKNLAAAGDDLAVATRALLSYPFTDGFVGNTVAAAEGKCTGSGPSAVKEGACFGDFANLNVSVDIGVKQLENLFGTFDLAFAGDETEETPTATDPLSAEELTKLISGLIPGSGGGVPDLGLTPKDKDDKGDKGDVDPTPTPTTSRGGLFCLLGACRAPVASSSDVGRLLVEPVEAP